METHGFVFKESLTPPEVPYHQRGNRDLVPGEDYKIQCLQEGLFFGLTYIKSLFPVKGHSYFLDGDCIFKGQSLLSLKADHNTDLVLSLLSYLSGAYTLASCFSERHFSFDIRAYWTKDFAFKEGEKQALLQAGLTFKKLPTKKFLDPQELGDFVKSYHPEKSFLQCSFDNQELVKQILKSSNQEWELMGDFLPEDGEYFRDCYNIKGLSPLCLQGFFPSLAFNIVKA